MGRIDRFNTEVKRYAPSHKGSKMIRTEDGKWVRLAHYHSLKLQCKPLDEENQKLHDQLCDLEDEFKEMKEDYNKRRSQAKRYQRSAARRYRIVEKLQEKIIRLEQRIKELGG